MLDLCPRASRDRLAWKFTSTVVTHSARFCETHRLKPLLYCSRCFPVQCCTWTVRVCFFSPFPWKLQELGLQSCMGFPLPGNEIPLLTVIHDDVDAWQTDWIRVLTDDNVWIECPGFTVDNSQFISLECPAPAKNWVATAVLFSVFRPWPTLWPLRPTTFVHPTPRTWLNPLYYTLLVHHIKEKTHLKKFCDPWVENHWN